MQDRLKWIVVLFREAQNCRDKKTWIFFIVFLFLCGKLGKQSLRFRPVITFFFGITAFLYQDKNPWYHMMHWRQFCVSLNCEYNVGFRIYDLGVYIT
jgi:hypothetical protein